MSAVVAFENLFIPSTTLPSDSTIPKCRHGVFDPHNGGRKAEYCCWCTPEGPHGTRNLVFPKSSGTAFTVSGPRANCTEEGVCPGCHSRVHEVIDEKTWKCAECSEKFPAGSRSKKCLT